MTKLTDKQKKKIIADYVDNGNYSETARINNLPIDVINKLQDMQTFYRIESNYKLYRNNL